MQDMLSYTYEPKETYRDEKKQHCHKVEKVMGILRLLNKGYKHHQMNDCYILSWRSPNNELTTKHENIMFEAKGMIDCGWYDKAVQKDIKFCTFKMNEKSSKLHEQVDTGQRTKNLGSKEISAMVLRKDIAEAFFGKKATHENTKDAGVDADLTSKN